jgi:Outer membrane protein beta-barrel domain
LPNLFHSSIRKTAIILGVLIATSRIAPAQAIESAQRGAEIAPFAQYTLLSPDWGPTNDVGYTFGVDYTHFIRSIVQPSLEIRMTSASGITVNEHSYTGGLKLQTSIHGIRPYFTILAGKGFIDFNNPVNGYISDNSLIYALGGGATFAIQSHLDLRVDFSHQQWNIDPQTLTPTALGVGLAYRIPFRNGRSE